MPFTVHVEIDGLVHKIQTCAELATQLDEPLTRFGKYWLTRTKKTYEAQDFAPLAESTIDKRAQKGLRSFENKLRGDVRKADKRAAKTDRRGMMAKLMGTRDLTGGLIGMSRGQQNRLAVLAEFRRRHRGGTGGAPLSLKQQQSLSVRTVRAVGKTVNAPILGGLVRTLQFEVEGGNVELVSRTHQHFTEVHNKGGTAGHGAVEPKRETIAILQRDKEVLLSILKDHLLVPFQEGAHGPGY